MPVTLQSQCDLILDALQQAAGQWVSMPRLVNLSGSYNIHSRIDELRHTRGVRIENRTQRDEKHPRRQQSFYRIPNTQPQPQPIP